MQDTSPVRRPRLIRRVGIQVRTLLSTWPKGTGRSALPFGTIWLDKPYDSQQDRYEAHIYDHSAVCIYGNKPIYSLSGDPTQWLTLLLLRAQLTQIDQ